MWYKFAVNQENVQGIINWYTNQYPDLILRITEHENKIKLDKIEVPVSLRNRGIGTKVLQELKDYSEETGKPVVLNPEPEKGKKGALERFYKSRGFVDNTGRKKDYDLSDTFSRTMYYKPKLKPKTESKSTPQQFKKDIESLIPFFVDKAQEIYDNWDEDIDEYAGGGICHLIADAIAEIVNRLLPQYLASTYTRSDIQHVQNIIYNMSEEELSEANENEKIQYIDLNIDPYLYETGGGFSWEKIPDVEFDGSFVYISNVDTVEKRYIGED